MLSPTPWLICPCMMGDRWFRSETVIWFTTPTTPNLLITADFDCFNTHRGDGIRGTHSGQAIPLHCLGCLASEKKTPAFGAQGPKIRDRNARNKNVFNLQELFQQDDPDCRSKLLSGEWADNYFLSNSHQSAKRVALWGSRVGPLFRRTSVHSQVSSDDVPF